MREITVSIIIPFFNSKKFLPNFLKDLSNIKFKKKFEIIFIDDGSKDDGCKIIMNYKKINKRLYSSSKNLGPSAARNIGLKHSKGRYILFLDVDDRIDKNIIKELYDKSERETADIIFCDRKWIENSKNLRKCKFAFKKNMYFGNKEIKRAMSKRFYDPLSAVGLFQLTGRLIKRKIIVKNKLKFEKRLRYLEDEAFEWDLLGYAKKIIYIRKQLYNYHLHNNIGTALAQGILLNFPIFNYDIVKTHIKNSLKQKRFSNENIRNISNQGYIFLIVSSLISLTRSILLGKINKKIGIKRLENLINRILSSKKIMTTIKKYKISKKESSKIINSIIQKNHFNLKNACLERAKEIINLRRKNI